MAVLDMCGWEHCFHSSSNTHNLAVFLTYVDVQKTSEFGAESVLYAGVTLALPYTQAGGQWMVSSNILYKFCIFEL